MTDIATIEPSSVVAGDTWEWRKTLADYPAPTWTLKYYLRSRTHSADVTATADGADHLVTISKTTSAGYKAGRYEWVAIVDDGAERFTVGRGTLTVAPDPANTGAGFDPRSHARKTLEAIEAVIENRATKDQMSYTIGSRSLSRMPISDLLKFRQTYQAEVFAEEQAEAVRQGKGSGQVVVRL